MADYTPKYYVLCNGRAGYVSGRFIQKPKREKGPTENLRIYAKDLGIWGKKESLYWRQELIECLSFVNSVSLKGSILYSLQKNKNISKEIISQVEKRLDNLDKKLFWDACVDYHEINEIGKYLNEVLIGVKLLSERKIDKFMIPVSQTYPGIDSFGIKDNKTIPISSKYGEGARSQLFGLLGKLPQANFTPRTRNSQLYRLIVSYSKVSSQKMAVYDYALRKLLQLDYDIDTVYEALQNNVMISEVKAIKSLIMKTCSHEKVKDAFPNSVTSWLERLTIEALNACPMSVEVIKEHLEDMNLHQYHLDKNKWHDGEILYLEKQTWKCPFIFQVGKSLLNNLEANRGLLCYKIGNIDENV